MSYVRIEDYELIIAGKTFVGRTQIDIHAVERKRFFDSIDRIHNEKRRMKIFNFKRKNKQPTINHENQIEKYKKLKEIKMYRRNAIYELDIEEQIGLEKYIKFELLVDLLNEKESMY